MQTFPVSYSCMNLLSQRLSWEQRDCNEEMDRERLDNFLSYVERGDMFDYALLLNLPPEVQNQTLAFYDAPTAPFRTSSLFRPTYGPARPVGCPGRSALSTALVALVQHPASGVAELLPVAPHGRKPNPITELRAITTCSSVYFAARATACWLNFARSGGSILPPSLTLCCCAGAASINRTISRCW